MTTVFVYNYTLHPIQVKFSTTNTDWDDVPIETMPPLSYYPYTNINSGTTYIQVPYTINQDGTNIDSNTAMFQFNSTGKLILGRYMQVDDFNSSNQLNYAWGIDSYGQYSLLPAVASPDQKWAVRINFTDNMTTYPTPNNDGNVHLIYPDFKKPTSNTSGYTPCPIGNCIVTGSEGGGSDTQPSDSGSNTIWIWIIVVIIMIVVVTALVLTGFLYYKKRKNKE